MLKQSHKTYQEEWFSEMETEIGTYSVHCTYRYAVDSEGVQYNTERYTKITTPVPRAHRIHLSSTFGPAIINAIYDDAEKKLARKVVA